jgi:photosystem II stability/assembly factor-like uncharacterized protein
MNTRTRKQNLKNKCKKLYFFILIMCLTCISNAQNEGWHLLPFTPSQELWDIHCINEDTVIAVGNNGYIIRTTNGGSYWDSIYSTTNNTLYKVTFVNDSIGYICGTNGTVLKTENCGLNWTTMNTPTTLNLWSMCFINQDTGWIIGGNEIYSEYPSGGKGILMKTLNGGNNWHMDTNYTSTVSSVYFFDNDTGYIALNNMDSNFLCKTTDGGLSYDTILRDAHVYYYKDIVFSNAQTGYFLKSIDNGGIYKTDDYGLTWHETVWLYYPIFNILIMDSCNLYYNCWNNETGASSLENTFVGINHCTNTEYNGLNLNNYGFNGYYLQILGFDFINMDYGFCVGGDRRNGHVKNFIFKKGMYDEIAKIEKNDIIKIIPNPCKDKTTLFINPSFDITTLSVDIYNSLGQKITHKPKITDCELLIDLSKEESGVYIVSIKDKNKIIQNCKLVKY